MKELIVNNFYVISACVLVSIFCVGVQLYIKRKLVPRQYTYFRDILLIASWLTLSLWFGNFQTKVLICCAGLSCFAGIAESINHNSIWRILYPVIGAVCAYFIPVNFIRFPDNEYIYLTPTVSFISCTVWFSFFPFILRYLDEIPGLVGHVLAITFVLMLAACVSTGAGNFFILFAGLMLIIAFWSRFGNVYRQAGIALSSMWGFLIAGISIMGHTRGIVFSTVLFLSLGLFAIPILEILLNFVREIFSDTSENTPDNTKIYSRMLNGGIEHPEAVQYLAGLCGLTSIAAAWAQWIIAIIIILVILILRLKRKDKNSVTPTLWGINFDNVSMNYAVSKARGLISNPESESAQLIVTLNAIGMELTVDDPEYYEVVKSSAIILADGFGLCLGLRIMGCPVQERVAGIDFAENLCRLASVEGWPVYFAGASGNTAKKCAEILSERFPGLIVAGARDGYFDINDENIPTEIANSGAKILLAAMGQPRQEKWIYKHKNILGSMLCVGVGGAFDVFSGKLNRAPEWIQEIGFEWLYRLIQEPGRWRKNLKLITFVFRVLLTKIGLYRK
ncbi:MAG: WecB/TagA/CpsF family glycosyltransferase [Synergistaceae bacterium]|nr:WecB/TagA/CpsF family glycosyltransferase [Synergistaceae bacterium]